MHVPLIKLLIAEDHTIVRKGIRSLLEQVEGIEVVGEASCGQDVLDLIEQGLSPDVVLTDLNMPGMNGLDLVEELKNYPSIKVLILSMIDHESYAIKSFNAGARGYLLKNVTHDELIFAIRQVAKNSIYFCSEITAKILGALPAANGNPASKMVTELSKREIEVLSLIAEGFTNLEIAEKLFMSRRTVEGHRQNLLEKTSTKNTATLIRYAIRHELID